MRIDDVQAVAGDDRAIGLCVLGYGTAVGDVDDGGCIRINGCDGVQQALKAGDLLLDRDSLRTFRLALGADFFRKLTHLVDVGEELLVFLHAFLKQGDLPLLLGDVLWGGGLFTKARIGDDLLVL